MVRQKQHHSYHGLRSGQEGRKRVVSMEEPTIFSTKGHRADLFGFVSHVISVTTTQLLAVQRRQYINK